MAHVEPSAFPFGAAGTSGGASGVSTVNSGTDISVDNTDPANPYVALASTVTSRPTFNPSTALSPFRVGANAAGQKVTSLNSDQLDGLDSTDFAATTHTHAASAIVSGTLTLARGGTNADLSATGPGFLAQATSGASVTVRTLQSSDRADLGLATSDSPQFAGINVGHASDTTLTRSSAGVLAVEGAILYAQGGALGTPASGTLTNCTGGYADKAAVPLSSKSADYTAVLGDAFSTLLHAGADTTARTFTIPANASVAYTVGTMIVFVNQHGAGTLTIAITTDTLRKAGDGTTGSRTLAADGVAVAVKITTTEWIISGVGLT